LISEKKAGTWLAAKADLFRSFTRAHDVSENVVDLEAQFDACGSGFCC
jgi:hypothetical protein